MTVDAVGFGEAGPFVDRAELDVVTGLGQHLGDADSLQRAGVREPGTAVADHPDTDALGLGRDEVLDLTLVHTDLGLTAAGRERLDLLAGLGLGDDAVDDLEEVVRSRGGAVLMRSPATQADQADHSLALRRSPHAAVPPMVSDLTRRVG